MAVLQPLLSVLYISRSAKQSGQQGNQRRTDQGNATSCHQLLHSLRLRAGVVVAVTFQQVNGSPDTETCAKGYDQGL